MKIKHLPLVILTSIALASSAPAALTAYDGFDYPAGDLTGANGGSGWSGAYTDTGNSTVATTTGLSYGELQTTPGAARMADGGTATTINFRNLGATYGDDETETWISFLARRNGATATNRFAGVTFYNSGGILATNGEVSFANTTTTSPLQWRIFDPGDNGSSLTPVTIASDITYLLVARIVWGTGVANDAVSLFVNPSLGSTPLTPDATKNINMTNFDKVRLAGEIGVDYTFDEIRIGGSFADVTPVPEASTTLSLLLGLGFLMKRRRTA